MSKELFGSKIQFQHGSFSDQAYQKSIEFQPRSNDCFVVTPPKTGTTLLQFMCHLLRSAHNSSQHITKQELEIWCKNSCNFEDLYQVAPWAMMAWDIGIDITDMNYEQHCPVSNQIYPMRIFKSHQRLAAMNPGAKYIVTVRDPRTVLVSWYNFLKNHEAPPVLKYASASEFAFDKEFFAEGMRFGASLWEYYTEYLTCLKDPNVLVVVYEDLAKDIRSHLPTLARFLGLNNVSKDHMNEIARLCSKENMMNNVSKFDESWTYQQLKNLKRCKFPDDFKPVPRVTSGSNPGVLNEETVKFLDDQWREKIETVTGIQSYPELAQKIREEYAKR